MLKNFFMGKIMDAIFWTTMNAILMNLKNFAMILMKIGVLEIFLVKRLVERKILSMVVRFMNQKRNYLVNRIFPKKQNLSFLVKIRGVLK